MEGARPCRCACRCARRRSRAGPGPARPAAGRRAARRSRPATTRTPGAGMPDCAAAATTRRQAASPSRTASAKYGASSSVGELGSSLVGLGDAVQELGADDAAAAPDLGDRAHVDVPAVLLGAGDDLRRSPARRRRSSRRRAPAARRRSNAVASATCRLRAGRGERRRHGRAARAWLRDGAGEHGLGDAADRDAEVERVLHGPARRCPSARPGRAMTSTSGLPVSASTWRSTSAVISIR